MDRVHKKFSKHLLRNVRTPRNAKKIVKKEKKKEDPPNIMKVKEKRDWRLNSNQEGFWR